MFILFNHKLYNSNMVSLIERVLEPIKEQKEENKDQKRFKIKLLQGYAEDLEEYSTEEAMNSRFMKLKEAVGCFNEK